MEADAYAVDHRMNPLVTRLGDGCAQTNAYIQGMRFIKQNNFDEYLDCPANSTGIDVRYGELCRFFNIEFDPNGMRDCKY